MKVINLVPDSTVQKPKESWPLMIWSKVGFAFGGADGMACIAIEADGIGAIAIGADDIAGRGGGGIAISFI